MASKTFEIFHREEILPKINDLTELLSVQEGWVQLENERKFNISTANIVGKAAGIVRSFERFKRNEFRVPKITISKFKNAEIHPDFLIFAI